MKHAWFKARVFFHPFRESTGNAKHALETEWTIKKKLSSLNWESIYLISNMIYYKHGDWILKSNLNYINLAMKFHFIYTVSNFSDVIVEWKILLTELYMLNSFNWKERTTSPECDN